VLSLFRMGSLVRDFSHAKDLSRFISFISFVNPLTRFISFISFVNPLTRFISFISFVNPLTRDFSHSNDLSDCIFSTSVVISLIRMGCVIHGFCKDALNVFSYLCVCHTMCDNAIVRISLVRMSSLTDFFLIRIVSHA